MSSTITASFFEDFIKVRERIYANCLKNGESEAVCLQAKTSMVAKYIHCAFWIKSDRIKAHYAIAEDCVRKLRSFKKEIRSLDVASRIKAFLVMYTPFLCMPVNRIYVFFRGRGKYE